MYVHVRYRLHTLFKKVWYWPKVKLSVFHLNKNKESLFFLQTLIIREIYITNLLFTFYKVFFSMTVNFNNECIIIYFLLVLILRAARFQRIFVLKVFPRVVLLRNCPRLVEGNTNEHVQNTSILPSADQH